LISFYVAKCKSNSFSAIRHRSFCANQIRAFNPAAMGDIHGLIRIGR
jgi:hypothetical protein